MVKKMTMLMPDELHRQVREKSFRDGTTMTKIIIAAIEKSIAPVQVPVSPPSEKVATIEASAKPVLTSIQRDGEHFFLKIPAGVVDRVGLTVHQFLRIQRMIATVSKKQFIQLTAYGPSSIIPENCMLGRVVADKGGTLMVSLPLDVAKKLGLDHEERKLNWSASGLIIQINFVEGD